MRNGENVHKRKEKDKTTFYSPSEVWSLPAPFSMKPEERICGCGNPSVFQEFWNVHRTCLLAVPFFFSLSAFRQANKGSQQARDFFPNFLRT